MWDVILLDEVRTWYMALGRNESWAVTAAIDRLEMYGPSLGRPTVDRLKGSKFHRMKELRPAGTDIRILFIFDPQRRAVLLVSGDKAGQWSQWYVDNVPIAENRYEQWLTDGG